MGKLYNSSKKRLYINLLASQKRLSFRKNGKIGRQNQRFPNGRQKIRIQFLFAKLTIWKARRKGEGPIIGWMRKNSKFNLA
jgi:hypothetical protein